MLWLAQPQDLSGKQGSSKVKPIVRAAPIPRVMELLHALMHRLAVLAPERRVRTKRCMPCQQSHKHRCSNYTLQT